jgi:hypothetical protein
MKAYLVMYRDHSRDKTEYVAIAGSLPAAQARADEDLWMRTSIECNPGQLPKPDENGTLWRRDTTPYRIVELDYIDA